MKTFAFFSSPRTLLAILHLFAPFFTPNRLKSGALQWGEGRKTKNGCDAYARNGTFTSRVHPVRSFFVHPVFHLARRRTSLPRFLGYPPPFDEKRGGVFGSPHGGRRSAACAVVRLVSVSENLPHKVQSGARKSLPFVGTSTKILYICSKTSHRGRRATPHSHPYEETAVSPSQRRRLLPHHQ